MDTNTSYLAQELGRIGVTTRFRTSVGDRLEEISQVIRSGVERCDMVMTTGGLGPTLDDQTREAVARGTVYMAAETLALITSDRAAKGDVLTTAQLAGIMAAKRAHELILLCHPLPLTGIDVSEDAGVETAARFFLEQLGAGAALLKGGHRKGSPDDLLALPGPGGVSLEWLRGDRIDAGRVHGTGCALSSAITASLARGDHLSAAVARGREFVAAALSRAESVGQGAGLLVFP